MSSSSNPCTVGVFRTVFSSDQPADQVCPRPVVQLLQIKAIPSKNDAPERYRVVLSDSQNFVQSMLATQANHHVHQDRIRKGGFIRLTSYQANYVKDKKILIVIGVEPLPDLGVQEKIGSPVSLEESLANGGASPKPVPEPAALAPAASAGTFYGNNNSAAAAQPRAARPAARSGGGASSQNTNIYPIEAISPYQNKWTIKARVSHKSERKEWNNGRTEGRLFTVNFLDETGEIRATGFNDDVDKLYDVLQEGQVYYVSKARVQMAKKQFSNVNNDYELTFTRDTEVQRCDEPDDGVPQMRLNFVKISDLDRAEKDATVDVLGVIKDVSEVGEIISKSTHKPHNKREITIVDNSETQVRVTVWGEQAVSWDLPPDTIVAFKGVRVGDFGGRSLSMLFSSSMYANPDIEEAHALKGWYEAQGNSKDLSSFLSHQGLSAMGAATGREEVYKNLAQVRDENLGMNDQPDYFSCKATVVYIKHENVSYPACLNENCNKKVIQVDERSWRCEKCNTTHEKPQYRYIVTISVNDAFGQAWLNCFDDVGRLIMGKPADYLEELRSENDMKAIEDLFSNALCASYVFRIRAKQDNYGETQRVRYQVLNAKLLDYAAEARKLADVIRLYNLD